MVIVQSKYYENISLKGQDVAGELYKITETIKAIDEHRVEGLSEKVVAAYRNARDQMEENGIIRIVFFTSYQPKNKRERNKLEKANREIFKEFDLEMNFRSEIEAQIETIDNGKLFVESDKLELDRENNVLRYEDSAIVNVSARSLQELQNRRGNGLLGMNLRYYVRQKMVDDGIQETIKKEQELFFDLFGIIGDEVLGYCYDDALERAKSHKSTLEPSNYLKLDTNYYKDILKRLWRRYNKNDELKQGIGRICQKNKEETHVL